MISNTCLLTLVGARAPLQQQIQATIRTTRQIVNTNSATKMKKKSVMTLSNVG